MVRFPWGRPKPGGLLLEIQSAVLVDDQMRSPDSVRSGLAPVGLSCERAIRSIRIRAISSGSGFTALAIMGAAYRDHWKSARGTPNPRSVQHKSSSIPASGTASDVHRPPHPRVVRRAQPGTQPQIRSRRETPLAGWRRGMTKSGRFAVPSVDAACQYAILYQLYSSIWYRISSPCA